MKELIYRILASASAAMWAEEPTLGKYTSATAEHELNLAFHYASRLRRWFPWLDCDFDVMKRPFNDRRPDIMFHCRGCHSLNFLVVEVKRRHDLSGGRSDLKKVHDYWFKRPLRYRFGVSVVFDETRGTAKFCVIRPEDTGAQDKYLAASDLARIAIPADVKRLQACRECVAAISAAEHKQDRGAVNRLRAELDSLVLGLYGLTQGENLGAGAAG